MAMRMCFIIQYLLHNMGDTRLHKDGQLLDRCRHKQLAEHNGHGRGLQRGQVFADIKLKWVLPVRLCGSVEEL